jgi:hypothetical protein
MCSDYANAHEILIDERAGELTKDDKLWLDMDGDGHYCEERGVAWKGERLQGVAFKLRENFPAPETVVTLLGF